MGFDAKPARKCRIQKVLMGAKKASSLSFNVKILPVDEISIKPVVGQELSQSINVPWLYVLKETNPVQNDESPGEQIAPT